MQQASQTDESAIRTLLDKYTAAIEAKDADATVACYSSDAVAFDLAPPLVMGPDVVRDPRDIQTWFDTWATPIGSKSRDLKLRVGGDIAYAFCLQHMTGKKKDGDVADLWFRSTALFKKENGNWKICHIHNSVPFAMDGSGKALLDLKPQSQ
jgi:ketosteroid isomerase-like protein